MIKKIINQETLIMPSKKTRMPFETECIYHIFNRANNKEKLFYSLSDYKLFLNLYNNTLNNLVDTYSYCLLPNHFHFLIRIREDTNPREFNKNLRKWFIKYAMIINAQENRRGSLFTKPVNRAKVDNEEYLKQLIYYIHSNPVKHNISDHYDRYPHSSFPEIVNMHSNIVNAKLVLVFFNNKVSEFIEFHQIKHSLKYFDYELDD